LPKKHKGAITDVREIIHHKIVVFSTLKKQLVFWNLSIRMLIKIIDLDFVSIHTMTYIPDYKILATANFGNIVSLWKFIDQDITK